MRLSEALTILQKSRINQLASFRLFVGCSFSPLHLKSFLAAHLQTALPHRSVQVATGLYGDLAVCLEGLEQESADAGAILIEWADLDPRLGIRSLGGWRLADLGELCDSVRSRLARLEQAITKASIPLAVCLPTLPMAPVQSTVPTWQCGIDAQLREQLWSFAARIAAHPHVKLVNPEWLDRISPPGDRLDVKSEVLSGFPYKLPHADAVAEMLAGLLEPRPCKKGLITDLDNTLWKGILGEAGVDGVSWDLDRKSHLHALYQELLGSLAATGVLLAVASKNEAALVEQAFARPDLRLTKDHVFPFEVHWNRKSESVGRILQAWNIAADSVVFVDDSPLELAEVEAAHPGITCLPFPADMQAAYELLAQLRNLFAKGPVTEEDRIRLSSIRSSSRMREESNSAGSDADAFLEQAGSELELDWAKTPWDPRVLELLNKTNQFNLNGIRYTESELRTLLADPDSFLLKASYQDKFGPLGKVAVLLGRAGTAGVEVEAWVMSCRAFSRRIEHECLHQLFEKFPVDQVRFRFARTDRNQPLQEFFAGITGQEPGLPVSRDRFYKNCPRLFHRVLENVHG